MATEKRLINATPIIDECRECSVIEWNKSVYTTWAEAEEEFMQRLLDAPVVDAVEVVRCKDCKYQTTGLCPMENIEVPWVGTKDYDFCSFGERRTDE